MSEREGAERDVWKKTVRVKLLNKGLLGDIESERCPFLGGKNPLMH